jgi:hypothetical protein
MKLLDGIQVASTEDLVHFAENLTHKGHSPARSRKVTGAGRDVQITKKTVV